MKKLIRIFVSLCLCAAMLLMSACSSVGTGQETTIPGSDTSEQIEPGSDNELSAGNSAFGVSLSGYDADKSDFQLAIDAGKEIHDISELLFGIFLKTSISLRTEGCMRKWLRIAPLNLPKSQKMIRNMVGAM